MSMMDPVTPTGSIVIMSATSEASNNAERQAGEARFALNVLYVVLFVVTLPVMFVPYIVVGTMIAGAIANDKKLLRQLPPRAVTT